MIEQPIGNLREELRALLKLKFYDPVVKLNTADKNYVAGDENQPFLSEAFLANLVGVNNAKIMRRQLARVCQSIGFGIADLEKPNHSVPVVPYFKQHLPEDRR